MERQPSHNTGRASGTLVYRLQRYFFMPYLLANLVLWLFGSEVMYFFQAGHQPACQRQIRPRNDLGLLSYLALKPHFSHECFATVNLPRTCS